MERPGLFPGLQGEFQTIPDRVAADPCGRNHTCAEPSFPASCKRKCCKYAILSYDWSADPAGYLFPIHIPGDRNLCQ